MDLRHSKAHCVAPLGVGGLLFLLISILQAWRYFEGYIVLFGTTVIPLWVSLVIAVVAFLLAIWLLYTAFSCSCSTNGRKGH